MNKTDKTLADWLRNKETRINQNQKEETLLLTLQKYQDYEENTMDHIPANQITYMKQIPRQTTKTD